jgi:hypothetical protein
VRPALATIEDQRSKETTMTRRTRAVGAAAAVALAMGATGVDARAAVSDERAATLQRQIDRVLAHSAPGGQQIAPNRVTWRRDGVTLTLPVPGQAHAAVGVKDCPRGYACLWQDTFFRSRRVQFFHYRLYRLAAYGMPPGKRRGASSYANHQTGGARAWLTFFNALHEPFDIELFSNGSLHGRLNDAAHYIELAP